MRQYDKILLLIVLLGPLLYACEERIPPENKYYGFEILRHETPEQMPAGETLYIPIRLKNTGWGTWPANKTISLSYHFKTEDGEFVIRDGKRTPLPRYVPPGAFVDVSAKVQTPVKPGKHTLIFDMVHEKIFWFEERGTKPFSIPVEIYGSGSN